VRLWKCVAGNSRSTKGSRSVALLSGEVNKSLSYASEIFQQLYIESWARQWSNQRIQVAA
jgi:hypothetical protein